MTDKEMLQFCFEAVKAMTTSPNSARFMKAHKIKPPNAVNASHALGKALEQRLQKHLSEEVQS